MTAVGTILGELLSDGRVRCGVCPRACRLAPGDAGICGGLRNIEDRLSPTSSLYFVEVRSAEACGLAGLFPGTAWLAVESAGSGLEKQRQAPRPEDYISRPSPSQVVFLARAWQCAGVYLAKDDPAFGISDGVAILDAARRASLRTAVHSSGYLSQAVREDLLSKADVVGLDLFSVHPRFYRRRFAARPEPVFETVEWLRKNPRIRVEVTIPIAGSDETPAADFDRLMHWIQEAMGPETPIHVKGCDGFSWTAGSVAASGREEVRPAP